MRAIQLDGWEKFGQVFSPFSRIQTHIFRVSHKLQFKQQQLLWSAWRKKAQGLILQHRALQKTNSYEEIFPSKFFSAIQLYCSRLSVSLLSYDSRSTLFWLESRKKFGRPACFHQYKYSILYYSQGIRYSNTKGVYLNIKEKNWRLIVPLFFSAI